MLGFYYQSIFYVFMFFQQDNTGQGHGHKHTTPARWSKYTTLFVFLSFFLSLSLSFHILHQLNVSYVYILFHQQHLAYISHINISLSFEIHPTVSLFTYFKYFTFLFLFLYFIPFFYLFFLFLSFFLLDIYIYICLIRHTW